MSLFSCLGYISSSNPFHDTSTHDFSVSSIESDDNGEMHTRELKTVVPSYWELTAPNDDVSVTSI